MLFTPEANMPLNAIPELLAGFVYKLTGENHLTEIEACATGFTPMYREVEVAMADIHAGGVDYDIQAVLNFALVALQVPQALHTCEAMSDELKDIEQWAAIFTNPSELVAKATKSMLLHRKEITGDISTTEADWAAAKYFKTGEDVADLLYDVIGPIEAGVDYRQTPQDEAIAQFAAGLIFGLTGDNNLDQIEGCFTGSAHLTNTVQALLGDLRHLHVLAAFKDIGALIWFLPDAFDTCTGMGEDFAAIKEWAAIFKNPEALGRDIGYNYLIHSEKIHAEIDAQQADWATGNYFASGTDVADILVDILGPIQEPAEDNSLPDPVPYADFIAGLIYGLTGDNHLSEIETCFNGGKKMADDTEEAISLIKDGHFINGLGKMGDVLVELPESLENCQNIDEDLDAIKEWAVIFKQPLHLSKVASKNWLFHGVEIKKDIAAEQDAWASGNYFEAGEDTADALVTLLGPIEPAMI